MSIPTNNVIRSATRKETDPLNILWFPYDGIFETFLCQYTLHNYYGGNDLTYIPWETSLFPPTNFYVLQAHNSFSMDIDFDLVVCNNRMHQYDKAKALSTILHIPLMVIEHSLAPEIMKVEDRHIIKEQKQADFYFVTHDNINESWNTNYKVIPYGIPNYYQEQEKIDQIILAGNFLEQDYPKLKQIIENSPIPIKVYGNNPGLSDTCSHGTFIEELKKSKYFLNATTTTVAPLMMLMAMSAGCIPVTNVNTFTDKFIQDVGLTFINQQDISDCLKEELSVEPKQINQIIMDQFSHTSFLSSWHLFFESIYSHVYTR